MNNAGEATAMQPKVTLLIISFSNLVSDARLLKQIRLLSEHYTVTTCGYGQAPEHAAEHIELSPEHPVWAYDRVQLMTRQFSKAYWGNPAIDEARGLLRGRSFDLVLANDVDPVGIALEVPTRYGLHVDLHEYSPRQKEDLLRWRVFVAPFIRWMVRTFVTQASSWSTVSGGLAREYLRVFGFEAEVITNASPFHDFTPRPTPASEQGTEKTQRPLGLVHSGAALRDRKLETMIEAVRLSERDVTLDLFLTKNDEQYFDELRVLASDVGGVRVNEPVAYAKLIETLHGFDVGVFLLEPTNFSYRFALPNKIFDFVQARLGMIVGPSPEMVDVVTENGLGVVTKDFSPEALAKVIDELDAATIDTWKSASHEAARPLSSELESQKWLMALQALETGK